MKSSTRPVSFWIIISVFSASLVMLILGQTMAVFNYELAVGFGLQEDIEQISEFGVQINRGFGAGDTLIYVPLIVFSIIGLIQKRQWALMTTAAVMGISAYWSVTSLFMFVFLDGVPGYSFEPGLEYWLVIGFYILFGLWGLCYLLFRGNRLLE